MYRISFHIGLFMTAVVGGLFFTHAANAPLSATEDGQRAFRQISVLTAGQDYQAALAIADSLISQEPEQILGWFLRASILNSRAIDFEDDLDDEELLNSCERVENIANNWQFTSRHKAEAEFCLGNVVFYRSVLERRRGNTFKAIVGAFSAGKHFEEAVRADSTFWDAWLGLGLYYYHASEHGGVLKTIGIIPDRRDEGLGYVKLAAERGAITQLAARSSLMWMDIGKQNWDSALASARELSGRFPESRSFKWALGKTLKGLGRWEEAMVVYRDLLTSVRSFKRNNNYNALSCLHSIAESLEHLQRWEELQSVCDEALALPLSEPIRTRKTKDLRHLAELKETAERHTSSKP